MRGVDHVWERRYGWHWVVEASTYSNWRAPIWKTKAWLHEVKPKQGWTGAAPVEVNILHGYQPKIDGREGDAPGAE